ncbi:MAG: hypothetical protein AAF226_04770 [Verrucomicrobiota bacterium]
MTCRFGLLEVLGFGWIDSMIGKILPILLFALGVNSVFAQSDFDPMGRTALMDLPKMIRVQVEWIEVDQAVAIDLMAKDRRTMPEGLVSSNDVALREELFELIKKDEAQMLDMANVVVRSGEQSKVESNLEFIYPTEYDPPRAAATDEEDEGGTADSVEVTNPQATAFDTRNIGTMLDLNPILGQDGFTIDLNLAPELTYHNGFEVYGKHVNGGNETEVKMPRIFNVRVTTQVTCVGGQPLMIGMVSPYNVTLGEIDASRKVFIFIKADIIHVGLPVDKK